MLLGACTGQWKLKRPPQALQKGALTWLKAWASPPFAFLGPSALAAAASACAQEEAHCLFASQRRSVSRVQQLLERVNVVDAVLHEQRHRARHSECAHGIVVRDQRFACGVCLAVGGSEHALYVVTPYCDQVVRVRKLLRRGHGIAGQVSAARCARRERAEMQYRAQHAQRNLRRLTSIRRCASFTRGLVPVA